MFINWKIQFHVDVNFPPVDLNWAPFTISKWFLLVETDKLTLKLICNSKGQK